MVRLLILIAIVLAVLGGLALIVAVAIRAVRGGKPGDIANAEETRVMHDIYQGLAGMEGRLNSLETIMTDDDQRECSAR